MSSSLRNVRITLFDVARQYAELKPQITAAVARVGTSGRYILGSEVAAFEAELGAWLGGTRVVGVSSGTDAISCALLAAEVRGRVLTTPFTFFGSVSGILRAGCTPRFVDVTEEEPFMDVEATRDRLEQDFGAVLAVHLFGVPGPIAELQRVCQAAGVPLIEDAAQALGAQVEGRPVGTYGDFGCYSFFPTKSLGALGDGGAVACRGEHQLDMLLSVRQHGRSTKGQYVRVGGNHRLDELQAAVLRVKLPRLRARLEQSRALARLYNELLGDLEEVRLPQVDVVGRAPSCSLYTLRVTRGRAALQEGLERQGIESRVYYRSPLHLEPALAHLGYKQGEYPNAERWCEQALSLPLYAELGEEQVVTVANGVRRHFGARPWD